MAPALSSNSFLLNIAPQPRITLKKPRFTVLAKKAGGSFPGFRLGKSAGDEEGQEETTGNSSPFRFDFGKLPDVSSLVPAVTGGSAGLSSRRKDPGTVFVAGATGQAGVRISQTLLRQGFRVRAGVSDLGAAQDLARLAASYKVTFLISCLLQCEETSKNWGFNIPFRDLIATSLKDIQTSQN